MQSEAPEAAKEACAALLELATPLLNAFAAAQASSRSTSLESEYAAARQGVLGILLGNAIQWAEAGGNLCCQCYVCKQLSIRAQGKLAAGDAEGLELLQSVETLAEAHRHDPSQLPWSCNYLQQLFIETGDHKTREHEEQAQQSAWLASD